ncbi:MAG TPA: glycosyltransferase family 1 protein [Bacteroidales bacterium]|nr:glycosyltransferase family 1 protein [Bacteroidales bacterium]
MKIGFDAKRAFLNRSGLGNYSRDVIRSLHRYYPENQYVLFTPEKETVLLEEKYRQNVVYPNTITKIGKARWRSLKMGEEIKNQKIDIFHGLSNELPININIASAKKVVTIHDLIFIKYPQLYNFIDRKIYYRKFYDACKSADRIIATSEQTKIDIINYFKIKENKIDVIYQACSDIYTKEISKEKIEAVRKTYNLPNNYILTVGTIERRKNVLNVLKAIYFFNLDVNYVVVGKQTAYCKEIIAYAKEHNMTDRLFIREKVTNDDMPAIYRMADMFVYPSIYEGFGIPILEAFHSEVPVITGDKSSTAEIAGDAAIQVDVLNPKSIGIAIKSVIESDEIKKHLINCGKIKVEQFDREKLSGSLIDLYKKL